MIRFLVIGSSGTLGSEFARLLPESETILLKRDNLDVTKFADLLSIVQQYRPAFVINCSAFTNVDLSESEYEAALSVNEKAVKNLALTCNETGSHLIHFSTGMVFEGTDANGYNEASESAPVNRYGQSKLAGESHILALAKHFYIIRTEWLYGKPQTQTAKKSFIELMIELGKSGSVKAVSDESGKPTWARDLAEATLGMIHAEKPNGIYHLANEGTASRLEWVKEIYKILEMDVVVEPVSGSTFPRPAKRPQYEILNNTKLPKLRSWQLALREYLTDSQQ